MTKMRIITIDHKTYLVLQSSYNIITEDIYLHLQHYQFISLFQFISIYKNLNLEYLE